MMSAEPDEAAIAARIAAVRQTIPPTVRLVAVSKQMPVAAIRAAYAAGVRDFGESRVQEAETKQDALTDLPDITWHLIGHLQSNKVQRALERFQWIHSIDSLKLARRVNRLAAAQKNAPNLCLQVKILPDPDKYGWSVPELLTDLSALDQLPNLKVRGLMSILPLGLEATATLEAFTKVAALADQIRQQPYQRLQMQELSMGMSGDYPQAVQAGATMIRLGRSLFGDRPKP